MRPKKLFKIGEVMKYSGLSRQTIHNYTMLGLIHEEERTEAGHRLYREDVFDRLKKIERLKLHRTLKAVKDILDKEDAGKAKVKSESEL
ncbi:MerR family DNA-binding transcriptional regulator [Planctomycetota bacterium]